MVDTANAAIIAGPNHLDSTFYTVNLMGGSWVSSASLENLKDALLSLPAISEDATLPATKFDLDLGVARDIAFIGFPDSNVQRDGRIKITATDTPKWSGVILGGAATALASTVRFQAGAANVVLSVGDVFTIAGTTSTLISNTSALISAGTSAVIDLQSAVGSSFASAAGITCNTGDFSGIVASTADSGEFEDWWPILFADGVLLWEDPEQWDGKRTDENAEHYPLPYIKVYSSVITARYWRFEIDDTGNTNGFVSLDRLFIAGGWVGEIFIEYGMNLGFESDTRTTRARGGAKFHDEGGQRRVARFSIPAVDRNEALQQPFDMQARLGTSKQVFVVLDKDDTVNLHRLAFIGTMRRLPPQEWFWFDANRVPFEIEEDIA